MIDKFTLALPSKGAIAEPTKVFLQECGLRVYKPNPRQYTGTIPILPDVNVLFQRVKDVAYKVADGTAQLGITGLDVIYEYPDDDLIIIHDALGYGHCNLVIAVPEAWVDVESVADLVDVALDFRDKRQRNLRVATTYTRSARQFLHMSGVHHFTLVKAEGAIEAAPTIGYADVIIDLVQTGTTLRENHLKMTANGRIMSSQACLIGNRDALKSNPELLEITRIMLEYIDGTLQGRKYSQMTVNICGDSAEDIGNRVVSNPITGGLLGPTISPIYNPNNTDSNTRWYTVTVTVKTKNVLQAVEHFRTIGAAQITTSPIDYVFHENSATYSTLLERL
jgi:ATP phosphoribosyltransferase